MRCAGSDSPNLSPLERQHIGLPSRNGQYPFTQRPWVHVLTPCEQSPERGGSNIQVGFVALRNWQVFDWRSYSDNFWGGVKHRRRITCRPTRREWQKPAYCYARGRDPQRPTNVGIGRLLRTGSGHLGRCCMDIDPGEGVPSPSNLKKLCAGGGRSLAARRATCG